MADIVKIEETSEGRFEVTYTETARRKLDKAEELIREVLNERFRFAVGALDTQILDRKEFERWAVKVVPGIAVEIVKVLRDKGLLES